MNFAALSQQLDNALTNKKTIARLTDANPSMTLSDAYEIQKKLIAMRIARGEKIVGYKVGLTSKEKQEQVHVNRPIYGVLTNAMQIQNNGICDLSSRIYPRAEAEIAFIIGKTIHTIVDRDTLLESCSGICAAIEIIDSRYQNFNFSLCDVVADNCSASGFVLSDRIHKPHDVDLSNITMSLLVNGKTIATGSSFAVLENPIHSLMMLLHVLVDHGEVLHAGSVVLSGAAMVAIDMHAGNTITHVAEKLGSVNVKC